MSVKNFIELINRSGGLSYSNTYDIEWIFPTVNNSEISLTENLKAVGIEAGLGSSILFAGGGTLASSTGGDIVKLFCDEAQLPSISSATGQKTGILLGEGQVNYPHTRVFTDFQLGWICDANMVPLKFLTTWYDTIFQQYNSKGEALSPNARTANTLERLKNEAGGGNSIQTERTVRLNYPEQYLAKCLITKAEKGENASNGRASIVYTMLDVFPYSIDAVPLSAGTSQATKVTANFYYSKHTVTYNDISKGFKG